MWPPWGKAWGLPLNPLILHPKVAAGTGPHHRPPRTQGGGSGLVGVELDNAGQSGRRVEELGRGPAGLCRNRRALPAPCLLAPQGDPGAGRNAWRLARRCLRLHPGCSLNSIAAGFAFGFETEARSPSQSSAASPQSSSGNWLRSDSAISREIEQAHLAPGAAAELLNHSARPWPPGRRCRESRPGGPLEVGPRPPAPRRC